MQGRQSSQLPKGYGGVKQVTPPRFQGEWGCGDGSCDPTKWGYRAATVMHLQLNKGIGCR